MKAGQPTLPNRSRQREAFEISYFILNNHFQFTEFCTTF